MRLATIIATPHPDAPRKWDIEAKVERDHFDTHVTEVEWYFGARSDDAVHTGKSLVVKDYTFKGDTKVVRVVITDTKGTKYRGEVTLSAAAEKESKKVEEPKKTIDKKESDRQPAKPVTEVPKAAEQVDAKVQPEPKKPFFKPDSKDLEEKTTDDGTDTKVVTPDAPKAVTPKK